MRTYLLFVVVALWLGGCTGLPDQVEPVGGFDSGRYLGTWYEIARLDHSFERGLSRVTAEYSLREDGSIRVLNRGYDAEEQGWKTAEGRAKFVGPRTQGHLKVSFFGPFYASYVIFELDPAYSTAYIAGYNHDYLWLLSRNPQLSDAAKTRFVEVVERKGFSVDDLIWVDQSPIRAKEP